VHIYSLGPKLLRWNFFKSLSYLYEVVRTKLSADFWSIRTNAHYVGGVNNYLNSNHTKYLAQLCGRFFAFLKISAANLRILWRHLPTELRNV